MLYKNPEESGKREVVVIDPSNFCFSSHLSNQDMKNGLNHNSLSKITTLYKQIIIYTPKDKNKIGPFPTQWRDCIDIAVKLALVIDQEGKKAKESLQHINLEKIKEYDFIKMISNNPTIDKSMLDANAQLRIKQASDIKIVKSFLT